MKKTLMIMVIFIVAVGGAFAQITIGGNAGVEYSFVDTSEDGDYNLVGFPVQAFGLYRVPETIPIEGFGEATVDAGLATGFINNVFSYEGNNVSLVPILGMGRLKAKQIYIDIAAGLYFPANDEAGDEISFGGYSEVGYAYPLNEQLTLNVGGRFTYVGTSADSYNMLAVVFGAEYQL